MANGVRKLRKIQGGGEGTAGTAVPATWIWRGTGTIEDAVTVVQPNEDVGYLVDVEGSEYIPTTEAHLSMDAIEATYEQLPYIQMAGIDGTMSGVRDGGSANGYIYAAGIATSAQKTPKTYTLEGGDNAGAESFAYGFVSDFTLSGVAKEAWKIQANWIGRQVAPATFTAALSLQTIEQILFGPSTLYIDDISAVAAATTVKASTLLGASLKVTTGFTPKYTGNGQIYFDFVNQLVPTASLDVTFEHEGSSIAEKAKWRAKTGRLLRIKSVGSALGGTPTLYPNKTMLIDVAGHWEKFTKIDEQNGNDIVTGTMKVALSTVANPVLFCKLTVVNALTVLV